MNVLFLLFECSFGVKLLILCLDVYKLGLVEWICVYYIIFRYVLCYFKFFINDKIKIFLDDVCCGIDCGLVWLRIFLFILFFLVKLWFFNIRLIYVRVLVRNLFWLFRWLYIIMINYFVCCFWIIKYYFKLIYVISFGFCIIYS